MSDVLAIVPARSGSRGIVGKNFTPLVGLAPVLRAYQVAKVVADRVLVSVDEDGWWHPALDDDAFDNWDDAVCRPPELATDECPMVDVVQDALARIPGPSDQIVVLLQPTQVLRTPAHVQVAIALLRETQADSVVSVVELPQAHSPELVAVCYQGRLVPWLARWADEAIRYDRADLRVPTWADVPSRRQAASQAYIRDGTVYAFWRRTVDEDGTIYGQDVRPLIIPAAETCPLDTPADWAEAERRLRERATTTNHAELHVPGVLGLSWTRG